MPQHIDDTNPHDQKTQIAILALRIENLVKEKEVLERVIELERKDRQKSEKDLEDRIAKMERTMTMGWGVIVIVPIIGSIIGFIAMYAKVIFAPWTAK